MPPILMVPLLSAVFVDLYWGMWLSEHRAESGRFLLIWLVGLAVVAFAFLGVANSPGNEDTVGTQIVLLLALCSRSSRY